MSREVKLALIVGFSLVLVVGVLISDHFSRASNATPADGLVVDLPMPDDAPTRLAKLAEPDPAVSIERRDALSTAIRDSEPLTITQGNGRHDPLDDSRVHIDNPPESSVFAIPGLGELRSKVDPPKLAQTTDDERQVRITPRRERTEIRQPRPAPEAEPQTTQDTDSQPGRVWHSVKEGETLYDIAKERLGRGGRWREIVALNPGRVGENGSVRSGVRIILPTDAARSPSDATAKPAKKASASPQTRVYEVKAGDMLGRIAQRELGSSKRIDEILALNSDLIDDADDIKVGMKLRLPAR